MAQAKVWALEEFQESTNLEYLLKTYNFVIEQARPAKVVFEGQRPHKQ